jgi:hypothetical protein
MFKDSVRISIAAAFVAIVTAGAAAPLRSSRPINPPPAMPVYGSTAVRQIPNSHIYMLAADESDQAIACARFTNQSARIAKRVLFRFAALTSKGDASGSTMTAVGPFAAGKVVKVCNLARGTDYAPASPGAEHFGVVAYPVAVIYEKGLAWDIGPNVISQVAPSSQTDVEITRAFAFQATGACVDFAVHGTRVVTRMQFRFTRVSTDGAILGSDPLDVRGTFAPSSSLAMNCRYLYMTILPKLGTAPSSVSPSLTIKGQIFSLVTSIEKIDYAQGPGWSATDTPVASLPRAANGGVVYDTWWPDDVAVPVVIDPPSGSSVEITEAIARAGDGVDECVSYVAHGPKATAKVHIAFYFTRSAGPSQLTDSYVDDISKHFTLESSHDICRTAPIPRYVPFALPHLIGLPPPPPFNGLQAGFWIVYPVQWSGGSAPLAVTYNGEPVTLHVYITDVTFADGSIWRAPDSAR